MESVQQSANVKEVLDSKEFRIWLPDHGGYIEVAAIMNAGIALVFSAGLASLFLMFTGNMSSNGITQIIRIFMLTLLLMIIYVGIAGFGHAREVRFNKDELEIKSSKEVLLCGRWEDIVEVNRVGLFATKIVSRTERATIWWSPFSSFTKGYPQFLNAASLAMATGVESSRFSKFDLPPELRNGSEYEYRLPSVIPYYSMFALVCLTIGTRIIDIVHGKDAFMGFMTIFTTTLVGCSFWSTEGTKRKRMTGVKIRVQNETIQVETRHGTHEYSLEKLKGHLEPNLKPVAFQSAEWFGTNGKSILIDRRFLKPI